MTHPIALELRRVLSRACKLRYAATRTWSYQEMNMLLVEERELRRLAKRMRLQLGGIKGAESQKQKRKEVP